MDFETMYRQYFRDVYLYLYGLSGSDTVAEEIAQETFVKALKAIDRFDGAKDIRAWLFTITKNTYYTAYKREKIYADAPPAEDTSGVSVDVVGKLANEERAFLIHQFLHEMKEPYKEVFSLRVFGELPFERIGTLFGKSAGWARVTFYRAKKQIAEYMEVTDHEKDGL